MATVYDFKTAKIAQQSGVKMPNLEIMERYEIYAFGLNKDKPVFLYPDDVQNGNIKYRIAYCDAVYINTLGICCQANFIGNKWEIIAIPNPGKNTLPEGMYFYAVKDTIILNCERSGMKNEKP